ncbi:MAG: ABC transporter permease [Anaerolineae bacterium]|nr:ABC transporter permease [Anaerolineae bacterium]
MADKAEATPSSPVVTLETGLSSAPDSLYAKSFRHFMRNRFALVSVAVILLIVLVSIGAPYLTSSNPVGRDARNRLLPPSLTNPMGTDELGRDVFTRVMYGGQISLQVGFFSIVLSTIIGVPLGLVAGYFGGGTDNVIMRVMDLILAFPGLILIIWLVGLLGSSVANVIFAIAVFSLPTYARLTRGVTLSIQNTEYVLAAQSMGASPLRVMVFHILPNIVGSLIVVSTLGVSGAIITGASLSFLGLGVRPPTPEWGAMLSDGRGFLRNAWWISFFPGMVITIIVLALNIVGDAIRDAADPNVVSR